MLSEIMDKNSADKNIRRTKFSADKNFRRTKFSAPNQNFGSFVRRMSSRNIFGGQNFRRTKLFGGQNFRHQAKFSAVLSAEFLSNKVVIFGR